MPLQRKDLRDEVAKLRRVAQRAAASDAQQDDDAEFRVQELSAQVLPCEALH